MRHNLLDKKYVEMLLFCMKKLGILLLPLLLLTFGIVLTACSGGEKQHVHVFGEWTQTTATCTSAGRQARACKNSDCTAIETRDVGVLGHLLDWVETVPLTETTDRVKVGTCQRSGCTHKETEITPALGTDGIVYSNMGNEYRVTGYTGTNFYVVIPANREGLPVTTIGNNAFLNNKLITRVTISATAKVIGDNAFQGCENLTTFSFAGGAEGSHLETIGNSVFNGCTNLASFQIPPRVKTIGNNAFRGTKIATAVIPYSIKVIENYTFMDCKNLGTVTFASGSSLSNIGNYAFFGCTKLLGIMVPETVEYIGQYAFGSCDSLANVSFHERSVLETIEMCAFANSTKIEIFTIPLAVQKVALYAFNGWLGTQTINVLSFATKEESELIWDYGWDGYCFAQINYLG